MLSLSVMEQLGFKKDVGSGADTGLISDFTLVDFQFLVVLMSQGRFLVFDCAMVLEGSSRQVRYLNLDSTRPAASDSAKTEQVFTRVEAIEAQADFDSSVGRSHSISNLAAKVGVHQVAEARRVLLFGKQAHRIVSLEFPRSDSPDMDMMEPPL